MPLDRERAARVLIEAEALGNDQKTAEKLGISDRTIRNYRQRMLVDPELAAIFREYKAAEAQNWHLARVRALRAASQRALFLLEGEDDLDKVTRFLEKAGGTDLAAEALGVSSRHHQPGPPSAEPAEGVSAEDDEEDDGDRGPAADD